MLNKTLKRIFVCILSTLCCIFALLGVACTPKGGNSSDSSNPSEELKVTRLELSNINLDIDLYGEKELVATVYSNDTPINETVNWSVSDDTIVKVVDNGNSAVLRGLKVGSATVTVSVEDIVKTCTCVVTDRTGQIPKLVLNNSNVAITVGSDYSIVPTVYYDSVVVSDELDYTFSIEDSTIATLTEAADGLSAVLKGLKIGKTNVYIATEYKDVNLNAKVMVEVKTSAVLSLNQKNLYFYKAVPGYDIFMEEVTATITPEEGQTVDYDKLIWESSNEEVVTVEKGANGVCFVENGKAGNAVITASYQVMEGVVLKEQINVLVEESSVKYTEHPTLSDEGLLLTLEDGEWFQYPKAINLAGKTSEDRLINFGVIPQTVGTSDFNTLYLRLTDVEDESNYVELKFYRYQNKDDYDFTVVAAATSNNPDTYVGYTNEKGNYGCWTAANFLGEANAAAGNSYYSLSFDDSSNSMYAYSQSKSMAIISDLDDTDYYYTGLEAWEGFESGKVYISLRTVGHIDSNVKSTLFIKSIMNYDLSNPTKTTDMPTVNEGVHPVDQSEGTVITLEEGDVYTAPKIVNLTGKTINDVILRFSVMPKTEDVKDVSQIFVKFTDVSNPNNYVLVKIHDNAQNYPWSYTLVKSTGQVFKGMDKEVLYTEKAGFVTSATFVDAASYFSLSFDYTNKQVYANRDGTQRIVADLDDNTTYYPDGPLWNGFTTGECYVSMWASGYTAESGGKTTIFIPTTESVTYKTDYQVNVEEGTTYYVNGSAYTEDFSLGDGLLVKMIGEHNSTSNTYSKTWKYEKPITLTGKTKSDSVVELMAIPTVALAREYAALKIMFTDTEDPTNIVTVRIQQVGSNNYCSMAVTYSGCGGNYWRGYVNATASPSGTLLTADTNGTRNVYIAFDYANRAIYSMGYGQSGVSVLADLDDDFYFDSATYTHWKGFTNGTAYVSIQMEAINTESHSSKMFVSKIGDYDLSEGYVATNKDLDKVLSKKEQ